MAQQAWRAVDIQGLTPALDLRRAEGLFAVGGKNYVFDSNGPKSAFGNRLLSQFQIPKPEHYQGLRLKLQSGDRVFHFHGEAILEWDEAVLEYDIVYGTPDTTVQPHRWTSGYLNGKMYFCHPATGILVMDIYTNVCEKLEGPGVPETPIAICVNNGRLVAIDQVFEYWSAMSDGSDFEPRLGGAGFQKISERVSGDPIMVTTYSRGVLVWTTGGVMRSEFTGDAEVYRHRNINTEYRPINSFCTAKTDDDTAIILDERGLFQSRGEAPTPLAPLFNEFLIKYLQKYNLNVGQNVRIEWDELQRFLYVSVSTSFASPIYERAFVLYPPLDKWGTFDEPHYGIVPIRIDGSQRADDYYGFLGDDSRVRFWKETGSRQSGDLSLLPLDASIQIGLIRLDELSGSNDMLSEITQVMIGNVLTGSADVLTQDFNLIPEGEDEDYNTATGAEDFGLERVNYINHKTRLIGTVDGTSRFDEAEPLLTSFTKASRNYACSCVGIWHMLELRADEVGESFHCRAFELTATYAGRIS